MYELLVLALLMHGPWHGYLISKFANEITGPWAKISPGSLYPLLSRLEQSGYIEALPQEERPRSPRQVHRYAITPAGRCRFHTLMMDTSSNLGDYPRIFHLKAMRLQFLSPKERLYLVDHYINYCERTILHIRSEVQNREQKASNSSDFTAAVADILQHLAKQGQGELAWAHQLRERIVEDLGAEVLLRSIP